MELSKESAERHYKKLLGIHDSDCLSLAQKVSVFQHDLEHDILEEITRKSGFFKQLEILKKYQERMVNGRKCGFITPELVSDIDNLKKWRNAGMHKDEMPELKYKSHFYTMAATIRFFSNIQWLDKIDDIINNQEKEREFSKKTNKQTKSQDATTRLTPKEAKHLCKENSLNLDGEITFSSRNKTGFLYWANPKIEFLKNNWWLLLNDYDNKKLYCFFIPANSINKNQIKIRKDRPFLIDLQIIYDNDLFEDSRSRIQFKKWFKKTIEY